MGSKTERIRADFQRSAGSYDLRWARYNLGSHLATIRNLPLRGDERILDLGCGTGELERHIECKWPGVTVVGVDLCKEMLAHARTKFSATLPIRFLCADGQSLPFSQGLFDIVVCSSAFHFIPDAREAMREMVRVAVPGGHVVLTDWCGDFVCCRLIDLWLRATGRAAHAGSLGSAQCRQLAALCGLDVTHLEIYRVGWIWGLMTMVGRKPVASVHGAAPIARSAARG